MGLLSGSLACSRFNVVSLPAVIEFDRLTFAAIPPGSSRVESIGFLPFEPGEPWEVGVERYAFRVRKDKIAVDATQLKELIREMVAVEKQSSGQMPNRKRMSQIKDQALEELLAVTPPRTRIVECYLDRHVLYLGTTSKAQISAILSLLNTLGIQVEFKTPWLDHKLEKDAPDWLDLREPDQSPLGCEFMVKIAHDQEVFLESIKGSVRLATPDGAMVSLRGVVGPELDRFLAAGAMVLSAKLQLGELPLTFDGTHFRIASFKARAFKAEHWTSRLEGRMEQVQATFEFLEEKFQEKVQPD